MKVLLDANILGLVTSSIYSNNPEVPACKDWLNRLIQKSESIYIPEISDYEVRRELLRAKKIKGIQRIEKLKNFKLIDYLPITTEIMLKAAELWAWARQTGQPTASKDSLDGDVILASTAITLQENAFLNED